MTKKISPSRRRSPKSAPAPAAPVENFAPSAEIVLPPIPDVDPEGGVVIHGFWTVSHEHHDRDVRWWIFASVLAVIATALAVLARVWTAVPVPAAVLGFLHLLHRRGPDAHLVLVCELGVHTAHEFIPWGRIRGFFLDRNLHLQVVEGKSRREVVIHLLVDERHLLRELLGAHVPELEGGQEDWIHTLARRLRI